MQVPPAETADRRPLLTTMVTIIVVAVGDQPVPLWQTSLDRHRHRHRISKM